MIKACALQPTPSDTFSDFDKTLNISVDTLVSNIYEEGTIASIKCLCDANPSPKLSLVWKEGDTIEPVSDEFVTDTSYETTLALSREANTRTYFCKAEHPLGDFTIFSEELKFTVACK